MGTTFIIYPFYVYAFCLYTDMYIKLHDDDFAEFYTPIFIIIINVSVKKFATMCLRVCVSATKRNVASLEKGPSSSMRYGRAHSHGIPFNCCLNSGLCMNIQNNNDFKFEFRHFLGSLRLFVVAPSTSLCSQHTDCTPSPRIKHSLLLPITNITRS